MKPEKLIARNLLLNFMKKSGYKGGPGGPEMSIKREIFSSRIPAFTALEAVGIVSNELVSRILSCTNYYARKGGKGGFILVSSPMKVVYFYFL